MSPTAFSANSIPEPPLFMRSGRACYLDFITKQLRVKTPEETVRQKLLRWLVEELRVPPPALSVEVPMSHYLPGAKGRADVVIHCEREDGLRVPVAVLECKAPTVAITGDAFRQVDGYATALGCLLAGVTNGGGLYLDCWNQAADRYDQVPDMPTYAQMCDGEALVTIPYDLTPPVMTLEQFQSDELYEDMVYEGFIGSRTPRKLVPFVVNLCNCLLLSDRRLTTVAVPGYRLTEDLGLRSTAFGNVSGGSYGGAYRALLLEDGDGNAQIVSVGVFGTGNPDNDPRWGSGGYTTLIVAIDDFDKHHSSLQLRVDTCVGLAGDIASIYHYGDLTIGKLGSAKRQEVLDFVGSEAPHLVVGDRVHLGRLQTDRLFDVNAPDVHAFLGNLVYYALLRDAFRAAVYERRKREGT